MEKDFSLVVKNKWFEYFISPLLTSRPKRHNYIEIFYDLAERAFINGIGSKDINAVREYLKVCEEILKDDSAKKELEEISSLILSDIEFEATSRLNDALETSNSEGNAIRSNLVMYTALVENFARPFLTVVYYFVHKYYRNQKGGPKSPDEYVNVSIAEKEKMISSAVAEVSHIDLSLLIRGLDMRIRHGGVGHEHWTILDDDKVEIKLVSSATGAVREKLVFTKNELSEKLKELEKLIWVIRTGFYVFLSNSNLNLTQIKPRTREGVESFSETFAKGRVLTLERPFIWNSERKEIGVVLKYVKPKKGTAVEIFMPSGAFEIIYFESEMKFKFQILDVLKCICLFIDCENYQYINVVAYNEDEKVLDAKYETSNLIKKIDENDIPAPISGEDISEKIIITWIGELSVPSGMKKAMIIELKKQYPDRKFLN